MTSKIHLGRSSFSLFREGSQKNGRTINEDFYSKLVTSLRQKTKETKHGMLVKDMLLLQNHTLASNLIWNLGLEFLKHLYNSPDLILSDPKLKKKTGKNVSFVM